MRHGELGLVLAVGSCSLWGIIVSVVQVCWAPDSRSQVRSLTT